MAEPSAWSIGVNCDDLPRKNWAACSENMRLAGFFGLTMTTVSAAAGRAAAATVASSREDNTFFMRDSLEYEIDASGDDGNVLADTRRSHVDQVAILGTGLDAIDLHLQGGRLGEVPTHAFQFRRLRATGQQVLHAGVQGRNASQRGRGLD